MISVNDHRETHICGLRQSKLVIWQQRRDPRIAETTPRGEARMARPLSVLVYPYACVSDPMATRSKVHMSESDADRHSIDLNVLMVRVLVELKISRVTATSKIV
jgi:hypothetical protein